MERFCSTAKCNAAEEPGRLSAGGLPAERQSTAASMRQESSWPEELEQAMVGVLTSGRRKQERPLLVVEAFKGLGPLGRVLRDTGLTVRELAAAEPKPHAKEFQKRNGLLAEHHFDDIRALIQGGRAPCFVHHGAECKVPEERADIFGGGFACQPTSTQRRSSRKRVKAEDHDLFVTARLTVEYLLVRRPRAALLEQTMGATHKGFFDETVQS
jgi:site-specific DNA-cytosine methylase